MSKLLVSLTAVLATAALLPALADAKSRKQQRVQAQPQTQIACTELGCRHVPSGCTPRPGRTWSGAPSGFDVVVCPDGRTYGRWY